jgi:hypothetical protein
LLILKKHTALLRHHDVDVEAEEKGADLLKRPCTNSLAVLRKPSKVVTMTSNGTSFRRINNKMILHELR